ncbi:class I adenylate-forming enzyme family protein [Kitasatospora terrestris]|uniref:AMP-dependent synthetase n=1 Tax=Kitasatospora terrestris TaxID=258051 RepID=A0ABP9EHX3_9ACTN
MTRTPNPDRSGPTAGPDWVDHHLLAGPDGDPCLRFDRPVDRAALRSLVAEQQALLTGAGLRSGGTAALLLPPSLGHVATLLAVWRAGGQAVLLDHRLTATEVDRALERLRPQVLCTADGARPLPDGRPAATRHVLVQLSSGSTGPSKVIARTADDLLRELDCYERLEDFPKAGGRTVLLSSTVHVLGLVGGLLHALHAGVELVVPGRATPAAILAAVAAGDAPTTLIGVPFHAELLAAHPLPAPLPQLRRMIVAGELVRPALPEAFRRRFGVPLGTMYGMTETGVIATDLSGLGHPRLVPVHGMELRVADGELHIRRPESPYLGVTDPTRWSDGLLHTRDAALIDPATGAVTLLGRRDSQVSIGGLKIDLTEVEQTLAGLPGVTEAVVVFTDGAVEAYAAAGPPLDAPPGSAAEQLRELLGTELAGWKLPRRIHLLPQLPRTATGKLLRDPAALRRQADATR